MYLGGRTQVVTHLEVGELSESLFAARMRALVGSVTCVDSAMGQTNEVECLTDTTRPTAAPKPLAGLLLTFGPQASQPPTLSPD